MVKVHYKEEVANHFDPESCAVHREVQGEALTGDTDRPAIEPRNHHSETPTVLDEPEGNTPMHVISQVHGRSHAVRRP